MRPAMHALCLPASSTTQPQPCPIKVPDPALLFSTMRPCPFPRAPHPHLSSMPESTTHTVTADSLSLAPVAMDQAYWAPTRDMPHW